MSQRSLPFEHQSARGLRQGKWKIVWSKRETKPVTWRLYDLDVDRSEQHDLADTHPHRLRDLVAEWNAWARRVGAEPFQHRHEPTDEPTAAPTVSPQIANRALRIRVDFDPRGPNRSGVLIAQGGNQHGVAVHLIDGRPAFDVRIRGRVTRLIADRRFAARTTLTAELDAIEMRLMHDGKPFAQGPSPGLLPIQPTDPLDIGHDSRTAAGDYAVPNRFTGKVWSAEIVELR